VQPTAAPTSAPAPATVKVVVLGTASDAGMYVADVKGFFRQQGIDVQYEKLGTVSEMIPLLSTGQIDVGGIVTNAALFNAVARGVDVKLVADKGYISSPANSFAAIVLRKDLADGGTIRDFKDLRGLTVALTPPKDASSNAVDLAMALAKGGLTEDDVNVTNLTYEDMNAAFASRAIDASIMLEPLITLGAERGLHARFKGIDEVYAFRQYGVIGYAPTLTSQRPDVARRFMVGYLQGVRAYNDAFFKGADKAGIVSILTQYTTLKDAAVYEKITPPGIHPDGTVSLENMQNDLRYFTLKGQVQGDPDPARIVDGQYADYAVEQLGKYQP
jgi:NitT/TauT family transport system substrate-binding protein